MNYIWAILNRFQSGISPRNIHKLSQQLVMWISIGIGPKLNPNTNHQYHLQDASLFRLPHTYYISTIHLHHFRNTHLFRVLLLLLLPLSSSMESFYYHANPDLGAFVVNKLYPGLFVFNCRMNWDYMGNKSDGSTASQPTNHSIGPILTLFFHIFPITRPHPHLLIFPSLPLILMFFTLVFQSATYAQINAFYRDLCLPHCLWL